MLVPSILGERLFDDFMGHSVDHSRVMRTDVKETDNCYELDIDLPGYKKEDVKIQYKDGYVNITASQNVSNDEQDKEGRYIRRERFSGTMSRSFYVGNEKIDEKGIHAKFEDGILKITLPKPVSQRIEEGNYISIE
ncbi:MAG: Hsp20/alpha crystallin family protein [Clostridia bacterium]|nr:Hsp20/alpha crystallin family protein [Clostridia bacterium]